MTTHAEHPSAPGTHEPHGVSAGARRAVLLVGVALVLIAGAALLFLHLRRAHAERLERATLVADRDRGLRLSVTRVTMAPGQRVVTLPGDVHGYSEATLYAKVSGYVKDVVVQRGQRVKKGDVMATLISPETQKDVLTAQRDLAIAHINAERAERLVPSGVVSVQDRDNAVATKRIAEAGLARASAVNDYTVIRAPYDGVVTARYVDPGALVPAATGATTGALPIVDVADVDRLRVFSYLGQDVAPFVHNGDEATVWQDELPARRIPAKVTFTTGALDPRTRTMQVEVDIDNRELGVLPGTFAHVEFRVSETPSPLIPDEAIVIRNGKTMVATIADGRAHYIPVDLGYNDGRSIRVLRGLDGGETVGLDVPVELEEGGRVQPVEHEAKDGG